MELAIHGISKSYGRVRALNDVSFSVGPGEIVALAGENGSGKSTLMKILAGIVSPDRGTLEVDGLQRSFRNPREALSSGIAIVSQEITAVPGVSVAENVLLTQLPNALTPFQRRRYANRSQPFLGSVGIETDPTSPLCSLRLEDRELIEVTKALAASPRLLLLDEATSRLSGANVTKLFAIVRSLRDQGVSTMFVTHRLAELTELADRTVILRDGVLVGELTASQTNLHRVSSMMVGREIGDFYHKRKVDHGAPVLEVENVVVPGTGTPISLSVRSGEIVALSGLVGSGRTELLETISGLRRLGSGRILLNGKTIHPGSPKAALAAGIALVPEDRHRQGLILSASITRNLMMGSWKVLASARHRREQKLAEESVKRLRIKVSNVDLPVGTLSGGNQQKVVFARCLSALPRVLLLDEPTRGIDVGAKEELFQIIGGMLAEGVAILMASSDMMEVLGLADRVIVLHQGQHAGELSRAEATEQQVALLAGGGARTSGSVRPAV